MLVPFIIAAVTAVGLLVMVVLGRQRIAALAATQEESVAAQAELDRNLASAKSDLSARTAELEAAQGEVTELTAKTSDLSQQVEQAKAQATEASQTLAKRTELADAQAVQIDSLSATRDDLQRQLTAAEERIATLAARPGVVIGEVDDDPAAEVLWDLEMVRSERSWRNSVAINPVDDPNPFTDSDDPVRTAIEIEAAALREDVGALITVDWKAGLIESAAHRVLVVRVAQEILAQASRAPGAARLVVSDGSDPAGSDPDGSDQDGSSRDRVSAVTMTFEAIDEGGPTLNLIPPPISADLIDVDQDNGLSVTVKTD